MQPHFRRITGQGSFVTDAVDHGPVSYDIVIQYNPTGHSIGAGGKFSASERTVAHAFHASSPMCLQLEDGRRIEVAIKASNGEGSFVVCKPQSLDEALELGEAVARST